MKKQGSRNGSIWSGSGSFHTSSHCPPSSAGSRSNRSSAPNLIFHITTTLLLWCVVLISFILNYNHVDLALEPPHGTMLSHCPLAHTPCLTLASNPRNPQTIESPSLGLGPKPLTIIIWTMAINVCICSFQSASLFILPLVLFTTTFCDRWR